MSDLCRLLLVVIVAAALWAGGAAAQSPSEQHDALTRARGLLATGDYAKIVEGVQAIAGSGAEHAGKLLTAMADRKAYVDKTGASGAYRDGSDVFDMVTNEKLAALPDGAEAVRMNNRVRNAIKAALGTLRLSAKDPAMRIAAAEAVLRAGDVEALPALDEMIGRESDAGVLEAFKTAQAGLILREGKRPVTEQLAAIRLVGARGDNEALGVLRAALQSPEPEVQEAAAEAIESIEQRLAFMANIQNVWYGLSLGSVLLLAAIGLAITFGVMGVINMAHGEMVMLGAYTTFVVQEIFRAVAPGAFDLSLLVAVPAAFLVAGLVGIAIERGIIRFLYGRPLETLLATWGVSLILQQAVRTAFGPTNREVGAPSYMQGGFDLFGLAFTYNRLWIILFTLVVFVALLAILRLTPLGLQMRAVTQNRRMAASMGIRTGYVDAMTFGLGSGIAGIAGVALSQIDNVSPNLGQNYIIDSFMVVVFGGVGSLWGTLVSAFALGVTNKLLEPWAGAVLAKIFILVLLILFIQKRPRGLFALRGRAIEG